MRTVMMSYNTFVPGLENGWHEQNGNAVLLLQNETGQAWGITQFGSTKAEWRAETEGVVNPLWAKLMEALPTIDEFVFYVGSYGAEHIIELAAKHGLTPEKTVFVLCDCNMGPKMNVLNKAGFATARKEMCECGGRETMRVMFEDALSGALVRA